MVKIINLMLCVLYYNLKIKGTVQGLKKFTKFIIVFPIHIFRTVVYSSIIIYFLLKDVHRSINT